MSLNILESWIFSLYPKFSILNLFSSSISILFRWISTRFPFLICFQSSINFSCLSSKRFRISVLRSWIFLYSYSFSKFFLKNCCKMTVFRLRSKNFFLMSFILIKDWILAAALYRPWSPTNLVSGNIFFLISSFSSMIQLISSCLVTESLRHRNASFFPSNMA